MNWNRLLWGAALTAMTMVCRHMVEAYDWQWWHFGLMFYAICIVWLG